jgi:flagellar biosynthesis anti-sigma factor FlgM
MKVDDPNLSGMTPSQVGRTQPPDSLGVRQKKNDAAAGTSRDEVALSDLSARIRELDSDSPERMARLEQLAAEVESGRYRVDAGELSSRIIDDALRPEEPSGPEK